MDILEIMKQRHSVMQYTNYSNIDLGIAKYHFEAVTGHEVK